MSKVLFGCGYLGERIAQRWHEANAAVTIVTRNADRAAEFQRQGYATVVADVTQPFSLANLPPADNVLFAVGYDRSARSSIGNVYAGGVKNVLAALPSTVNRFIYISTTGVYGNAGGDWIDETTPPDPQRDGGRASLAAEHVLASHPIGKNSIILRLAGIYGPGRIPFLDLLRAGEPIPAATGGHLNLIHVDDAAAAVIAADQLPQFDDGPKVFCVSDGHPVERGEYYREAARHIGAPQPMFVTPDPNSPRAMRAAGDRRVRNHRMFDELGVKLAYADYRAGLASILG